MFIGRVYENHKKNKQATNAKTYSEQEMKKRGRSRSRSISDDEMEKEPQIRKGGKDSENMRKSRKPVANHSPVDSDIESGTEEETKAVKQNSCKVGGDKSFMEKINEKVKKLKREKETKEPNTNGFPTDSKQVVYSITSQDVEKGGKQFKARKPNPPKEKFDSIELDSGDENRGGRVNSVGVQATPYPPFRLRLLPHPDWQESETTLLKVTRLVLCQCGLACVVLTWALIGALVFNLTEAPKERSQVIEMNRRQTELVVGLATALRQVVPEEPAWRSTIEEYATHHEALILSAVSSGYPQRGTIWTYSGCLLFATSLLTTLGFGAPVPRTVTGRISAIIFAGLGIPMHLLLVLNVGLLLAVKLHHSSRVLQRKFVRFRKRLDRSKSRAEEDWPQDIFTPDDSPPLPPSWIKFFPFVAIPLYYITGFLLFGVLRSKTFPEVLLFPLDFTAAGGVASTYGPLRIAYAIYLEGAVILASTNVALLRVTATRGFTTLGIKHGIMINDHK